MAAAAAAAKAARLCGVRRRRRRRNLSGANVAVAAAPDDSDNNNSRAMQRQIMLLPAILLAASPRRALPFECNDCAFLQTRAPSSPATSVCCCLARRLSPIASSAAPLRRMSCHCATCIRRRPYQATLSLSLSLSDATLGGASAGAQVVACFRGGAPQHLRHSIASRGAAALCSICNARGAAAAAAASVRLTLSVRRYLLLARRRRRRRCGCSKRNAARHGARGRRVWRR